MKILYSVAGEGNGHATRSKAVIDHLKKKHKIHITASAAAYRYLSKHHKPITLVSGLRLAYANNSVSLFGTLFINFANTIEHIKTIFKTFKLIRTYKPDLILNDFALAANYLGILMGIPVINLDNNRVAAKTRVKVPFKFQFSRLKAAMITNLIAPMGYFHIVCTFFYPPLRWWKNVGLVFSPIRKEIQKLKPKQGKHILVYQTSTTNKQLLLDLAQLPHEFKVYGYEHNQHQGNLHFKPFSEKEFFNDLANSKAVIMNGGFSLMAEALFLKKPILSIPVKGQFEQELNAIYLDKLKYGRMIEQSSKEDIKKFLKDAPKFHKRLKQVDFDPNEALKLVDQKIEEIKYLGGNE